MGTLMEHSAFEPAPPTRYHSWDRAYAWLSSRRAFFAEGWGDESVLASVQRGMLEGSGPAPAQVRWGPSKRRHGRLVRDGTFPSPQPGLPSTAATAHVRWLFLPSGPARSACVLLAGSREEGFVQREAVFGPLVESSIDLLLLESPFSGVRRGLGQRNAAVRTVSDHVLLNLGMLQEARALLGWLKEAGYLRRGVAGYSMGGFMAAVLAGLTREPLAVAALAAGTSAAPVFTRGLLSRSVDFRFLSPGQSPEVGRARLASLFGAVEALSLPPPVRPEAALVVGCLADGYVSADNTRALHAHWPGSTLRWLKAGHVSALFLRRRELRRAVADAFGALG